MRHLVRKNLPAWLVSSWYYNLESLLRFRAGPIKNPRLIFCHDNHLFFLLSPPFVSQHKQAWNSVYLKRNGCPQQAKYFCPSGCAKRQNMSLLWLSQWLLPTLKSKHVQSNNKLDSIYSFLFVRLLICLASAHFLYLWWPVNHFDFLIEPQNVLFLRKHNLTQLELFRPTGKRQNQN